jgi:hypothetical protein
MQPNSLDIPIQNRESDPQSVVNEPYELFDLDVDDNTLYNSCIKELPLDIDYWNQKPWRLKETDEDNIQYYLGEQLDETKFFPHQAKYVDNRLFTSTRAIIAYVFGQLAKPEITPSKGDDKAIRMGSQLEMAIYQHALNHNVNAKFRTAGKNMIVRKRGYIKLRFDPDKGPFGDVITESIDPADIVVDRFARLGDNPNRLFHRQKCTIEELCAKFPNKKNDIWNFYGIKQGRYSQISRIVTYYECWFTYYKNDKPLEGLCWFIPNSQVILDKQPNPNWIYKGSEKQQKIANLTDYPIKPLIPFNYLNTGRSYIDETSLFDQAKPQQDILNKRGRQITDNADYSNPRLLVDKRVMEQSDADKFVNKHPKTIGLVDTTDSGNDINKAVQVIPATMLPSYVVTTLYDARNEVDTMMGTPSVFRGEQPQNQSNTLGQDLLIKQQAGALQDDLVEIVNEIYAKYYEYLIQMMKVYCSDDYWILTKGTSGQYVPILLNSDTVDTNVKVGVQTDSTLPLDKQGQRSMALGLAKAGLIDPLTLYRDLGLPDPEERVERLNKYMLDKFGYMQSTQQQLFNAEADADITLLMANKVPEERENYTEDYLNHFNLYVTTNAFRMLKPDQQQRLTDFLHQAADKASTTEAMKDSMLDPSGMTTGYKPPMPIPKVDIKAYTEPGTAESLLGMPQLQGQPQAPPGGAVGQNLPPELQGQLPPGM